jgi:hypothetical protein
MRLSPLIGPASTGSVHHELLPGVVQRARLVNSRQAAFRGSSREIGSRNFIGFLVNLFTEESISEWYVTIVQG